MVRWFLRRGTLGWRGLVTGLCLGVSVTLFTFSLVTLFAEPISLEKQRHSHLLLKESDQYTLPSLEEVLQSSTDLDLQRVLSHYKLHHESVPPHTPSVRILLASTWRSGSTLLGEILSAHPGVYYHYEPFMSNGVRLLKDEEKADVNSLLSDLFRCNYKHLEEYLRFAFINADLFTRNTRLWSMCSALPRTKCYAPDVLNKLCGFFPIHVAKLVRVRLSLLEKQLLDPRVKLVWLVRDPRAIQNSRKSNVDWCRTSSCSDPSTMCSSLRDDYNWFLKLREDHPSKVMLLRYEDLAKDAYNKSRNVLQFAGLSLQPEVVAYLDDHLSTNVDVPWSTKHEPKAAMSKWMKTMTWDEVLKVQGACASYMKLLGYRVFQTPSDMGSGNAVGLLNLPQ